MRISLLLCVLLLATSCGKKKEGPDRFQRDKGISVVQGSLEETILAIQNDSGVEPCDQKIRDVQLEIARELDRRAEEIKAIALTAPPTDEWRTIQVGPVQMREYINPPVMRVGWQEDTNSWQDIITAFGEIKSLPTNTRWVGVNSAVKSILTDDKNRVLRGANLFLEHDAEADLTSLTTILQKCQQNEACLSPELQPLEPFIAKQPYYLWYSKRLSEATEPAAKRDLISRFSNRAQFDLDDTFFFMPNKSVKRESANRWILPLNGINLEGALPQLQNFIESAWNTEGNELKVLWTTSNADAFSILFSPLPGGRAFVRYRDKTINLVNNGYWRSISHEVGHVLGLSDTYFTVWNHETCTYRTQYREDDLMSDHTAGTVLPYHWEKLNQKYPL